MPAHASRAVPAPSIGIRITMASARSAPVGRGKLAGIIPPTDPTMMPRRRQAPGQRPVCSLVRGRRWRTGATDASGCSGCAAVPGRIDGSCRISQLRRCATSPSSSTTRPSPWRATHSWRAGGWTCTPARSTGSVPSPSTQSADRCLRFTPPGRSTAACTSGPRMLRPSRRTGDGMHGEPPRPLPTRGLPRPMAWRAPSRPPMPALPTWPAAHDRAG